MTVPTASLPSSAEPPTVTGPGARTAAGSWLRLFFRGGITSYRALFGWLSPWVLVPVFVVGPIMQILFFSFIGRTAGTGNDTFYLIGNAVQYSAIPCLFAMGNTIGDERQMQTLALLIATPARRLPLFLGRSLPVIINGFAVALLGLVVGALLLGVHLPGASLAPLTLVLAVCAFSCTGLGLITAALALRVRETAVLPNLVFGVLLIFCGADVALRDLPRWMAAVGRVFPLTHGIAAARLLAAGAALGRALPDIGIECAIGVACSAVGMALLYGFEWEARRRASLDSY